MSAERWPGTPVEVTLTDSEMVMFGFCISAGLLRASELHLSAGMVKAIESLFEKVHASNERFAALRDRVPEP